MKNLLNLGKTLNKNEQKLINGGAWSPIARCFVTNCGTLVPNMISTFCPPSYQREDTPCIPK